MNHASAANLKTCSTCGLNVEESKTTFSPTGDLLCRPCANHGEILATGQRAREAAVEAHGGRIGPFVGKGANAAVAQVEAGLAGVETDNLSAIEAAKITGAATFTCTCGKTVDVALGTKCADRHIRCGGCAPPFQAAVAEVMRKAAEKERIQNVIQSVVAAILVIAAIAYLVLN